MSLENFIAVQTELYWAFWWFAKWWLILLAVAGLLMAVMTFFLDFVGNWIESR